MGLRDFLKENTRPKQAIRQREVIATGPSVAWNEDPRAPEEYGPVGRNDTAPGRANPKKLRGRGVNIDQARLERAEAEERTRARSHIVAHKENASTQNIRYLRQLMRRKYALDVELWNARDVLPAMRPTIMLKCKRADDILQMIVDIVSAWEEDAFDSNEEWRMAKKIKEGVLRGGSTSLVWGKAPPWERDVESDDINGFR